MAGSTERCELDHGVAMIGFHIGAVVAMFYIDLGAC